MLNRVIAIEQTKQEKVFKVLNRIIAIEQIEQKRVISCI